MQLGRILTATSPIMARGTSAKNGEKTSRSGGFFLASSGDGGWRLSASSEVCNIGRNVTSPRVTHAANAGAVGRRERAGSVYTDVHTYT